MANPGFPITGNDPNDPTPGTIRDLIFNQNSSGGGDVARDVIFLGNKTSAGSETVNTLGTYIVDNSDAEARMGAKSELYWMYKKFREIDKTAQCYFIAVTEAGTASTFDITVVGTATGASTVVLEWGGETLEVPVASGDTIGTVATAISNKINQSVYWPFTVIPTAGVAAVTTAGTGARSVYVANAMRVTLRSAAITTTVTKGSVAAGATEDDFTTAYSAMNAGTFYCQISAKTAITTVTATDNGIGEHITNLASQALPAVGKGQTAYFGLVSTQANATSVGVSSPANNVYATFFHAENSPWFPGMIAAHCCAAIRAAQIVDPGANMSGYTNTDRTPFNIPDPYDKSDRPTDTEIRADLNNGITPIAFTTSGAAYIVRHVTGRNWTGSATTKDYRGRSGHIPSTVTFLWEVVKSRYAAMKQRSVAADPPRGIKPLPGVTYPSAVKAMAQTVIDDYTFGNANGAGPLLDTTVYQAMIDSVDVRLLADGISVHIDWVCARPNNKGQFLITETSLAS